MTEERGDDAEFPPPCARCSLPKRRPQALSWEGWLGAGERVGEEKCAW